MTIRPDPTLKVAALTSGQLVPSSRFRVRQHLAGLASMGVHVREFIPAISKFSRFPGFPDQVSQRWLGPIYPAWLACKLATRLPGIVGSWQGSVTWLERNLLPGLHTVEHLLGRPLVFDVDDAIWALSDTSSKNARRIAMKATTIVAGNEVIADWFSQWNANVVTIPTAVDDKVFTPNPRRSDVFRIGWIGTAKNLPFLKAIESPVREFLTQHPHAELMVVCDQEPDFLEHSQIRFARWSEHCEVELVQSFSVGLMPLPDNDWARGKCAFKMLQYMACEIPVIASPVGVNEWLIRQFKPGLAATGSADWLQALNTVINDSGLARGFGKQGREAVSKHYSLPVVTPLIADVLIKTAALSK